MEDRPTTARPEPATDETGMDFPTPTEPEVEQAQVSAPPPTHTGTWRDTREWIERVRAAGELRDVKGASSESDIGEVTALLDATEGSPAVLFDEIPGFAAGRRVIVNCNGTPTRQAITLGLDPDSAGNHAGLMDFWRSTLADLKPIPPNEIMDGPVFENRLTGG